MRHSAHDQLRADSLQLAPRSYLFRRVMAKLILSPPNAVTRLKPFKERLFPNCQPKLFGEKLLALGFWLLTWPLPPSPPCWLKTSGEVEVLLLGVEHFHKFPLTHRGEEDGGGCRAMGGWDSGLCLLPYNTLR